jgi:ankyrin repeat protein
MPSGFSALHLAAFSGDVETARLLLARGAEINARSRSRFKNTPLQVGLLVGQYDMTRFLIERGADVLVRQSKGFAPIHEAAFLGRRDLVQGAEIDARTNDGRTAVTEATRRKHPELAEYLKSTGGSDGEITKNLMQPPD